MWGGCWCTWFHGESAHKGSGAAGCRALKKRLVGAAHAHAALVYDGDVAVGWCHYGSPLELPGIYHRKQVETDDYEPPDYRLTCLFVDRGFGYRHGKGKHHTVMRIAIRAASGASSDSSRNRRPRTARTRNAGGGRSGRGDK